MKYVKIENGFISENAILSVIANSITKVTGVSNRHGVFIEEFIQSISGHDVNKGIKLKLNENSICEISVYVDVIKNAPIETVINNIIEQINNDVNVFLSLNTQVINVHVLEVK